MAIDTPAKLAILGAGPVGLEAALYARFLGYNVVIFERGEIAENVRRAAGARMDTPFGQNSTTLGLAAIQAQDETYRQPGNDEVLTGREWLDRYLLPLSQTDLLADHLRLNTTVTAVERHDSPGRLLSASAPPENSISRSESPPMDEGADWSFCVLSRDATGAEEARTFDAVLDCTGVDAANNWTAAQPDFYILGTKAAQPGAPFLMTDAFDQIRHAFTIIGDRKALDLYASTSRLVR